MLTLVKKYSCRSKGAHGCRVLNPVKVPELYHLFVVSYTACPNTYPNIPSYIPIRDEISSLPLPSRLAVREIYTTPENCLSFFPLLCSPSVPPPLLFSSPLLQPPQISSLHRPGTCLVCTSFAETLPFFFFFLPNPLVIRTCSLYLSRVYQIFVLNHHGVGSSPCIIPVFSLPTNARHSGVSSAVSPTVSSSTSLPPKLEFYKVLLICTYIPTFYLLFTYLHLLISATLRCAAFAHAHSPSQRSRLLLCYNYPIHFLVLRAASYSSTHLPLGSIRYCPHLQTYISTAATSTHLLPPSPPTHKRIHKRIPTPPTTH